MFYSKLQAHASGLLLQVAVQSLYEFCAIERRAGGECLMEHYCPLVVFGGISLALSLMEAVFS